MRKRGESIEQFCKKQLPKGMEFAHPPVEVAFWPAKRNIVMLFRKTNDVDTNYTLWAFIPAEDEPQGTYQKYEAPSMDEAPGHFEITVQAVFGASLGDADNRDLVVLYAYHRNGSTADDSVASYVYRFYGKAFATLTNVSHQLAGVKTAAEVRAKMQKIKWEP